MGRNKRSMPMHQGNSNFQSENQPFTVLLTVIVLSVGIGFAITPASADDCLPNEELQKLIPTDAVDQTGFGTAVSQHGNLILIGAPPNNSPSGSAYLVDMTTGAERFKFKASDARQYDGFGFAVALDGNLALVGAPFPSADNGGAAFVFDVTTGEQLFRLTASDATKWDNFGSTVSLDGNLAIVGASGVDDSAGAAYLFDLTTGVELFKFHADERLDDDEFGGAVALDGNRALVSAISFFADRPGVVYVFDVITGELLNKLTASDGPKRDLFGTHLALNGDLALIGANEAEERSGAAYLIDISTSEQLHKFTASDGKPMDFLGSSVALNNNLAVVGTHQSDSWTGSAYLFDIITGKELYKFTAPDRGGLDYFARSVAIDGNSITIGAPGHGDLGGVFVYGPVPVLSVEPMPLVVHEPVTLSACGLNPNQRTWLLYSFDGLGSKFLPRLDVVIDILNPSVAARKRADETGNVRWNTHAPWINAPTDIWFQTIQHSKATNYVATQIVP